MVLKAGSVSLHISYLRMKLTCGIGGRIWVGISTQDLQLKQHNRELASIVLHFSASVRLSLRGFVPFVASSIHDGLSVQLQDLPDSGGPVLRSSDRVMRITLHQLMY